MGSIIFLPGILGSELKLGIETVWPPTPFEIKFGYERVDKLVDKHVVPGSPIDHVLCFDVYRPLLRDLAEIASGTVGAPARAFHPWGYDWRLELRDTADAIVARIDKLPAAQRDEIRFVGHSMGCLIIRLILESGKYDQKPWHSKIKSFTALAGPHQGSPTALVRALGLEGTLGLSPADVKTISANRDYPALYQLLPAPGIAALLDAKANRMTELDLYDDPQVVRRLGLDPGNLAKAKEVHAILAANRRPAHVEYVYLAGSGNDTWLRVDLIGNQPLPRKGQDTGDGTVPLWSAVDPSRVHHAAPATHDKVFMSAQLRTLLYFSLGARPPAIAMADADARPLLSIFATHPVYAPGTPIELLVVPARPTALLEGELAIAFAEPAEMEPRFEPFDKRALVYRGQTLDQLQIRLEGITKPGFYRISFSGSHAVADGGIAMFAVSETGGVRRS